MMAGKKTMSKKAVLLITVLMATGLTTAVMAQDAGFQPAMPDVPAAASESAPVAAPDSNPVPTPPPDSVQNAAAPVPQQGAAASVPALPSDPSVTMGNADSITAPIETDTLVATAEAKSHVHDASVTPEAIKSLFFTSWQHALLQEAKVGFNTRLPNPGEVAAGESGARDPGIREIALGGIAYANVKKWAVWLNGVRITPDAIPEQVLDIKVSDAYIDLKWFDGYTNKIYPIRLRPHERFNLDTRIFLPGNGT